MSLKKWNFLLKYLIVIAPNWLFVTNVYNTLEPLSTKLQWTKNTSVISQWDTFFPFLSLVILISVLSSNFNIFFSSIKSFTLYPDLIWNIILFSIFFMQILICGLSVTVSVDVLKIILNLGHTKYDRSSYSNFSIYI